MSKIVDAVKRTIQGIALDKSGAEVCDPKPKFLPTGIKRPPTQEQRLMRILQAHNQQMQENQEYADETDFDIDEDDMLSPYERQAHIYDMTEMVPVQDEADPTPSPAKQSGAAASGGAATAEPEDLFEA